METPETLHVPCRPGWDCVVCLLPWPCAPAKVALLDEYGKQVTALVIYLAVQMIDAIEDATAHGGPAPAGMFERFLGWDRHKPISDESSSRHA